MPCFVCSSTFLILPPALVPSSLSFFLTFPFPTDSPFFSCLFFASYVRFFVIFFSSLHTFLPVVLVVRPPSSSVFYSFNCFFSSVHFPSSSHPESTMLQKQESVHVPARCPKTSAQQSSECTCCHKIPLRSFIYILWCQKQQRILLLSVFPRKPSSQSVKQTLTCVESEIKQPPELCAD